MLMFLRGYFRLLSPLLKGNALMIYFFARCFHFDWNSAIHSRLLLERCSVQWKGEVGSAFSAKTGEAEVFGG